jgi:chromosome segregation ATPase
VLKNQSSQSEQRLQAQIVEMRAHLETERSIISRLSTENETLVSQNHALDKKVDKQQESWTNLLTDAEMTHRYLTQDNETLKEKLADLESRLGDIQSKSDH